MSTLSDHAVRSLTVGCAQVSAYLASQGSHATAADLPEVVHAPGFGRYQVRRIDDRWLALYLGADDKDV